MKILVLSRYRISARLRPLLGLPDDVQAVYAGIAPQGTDDFSRAALKEYRDHFLHFTIGPGESEYDGILALGNEGLFVTTGHSGIMKYRGKDFEALGIPVVATVSPAAVDRNPSTGELLRADVDSLIRRIKGETVQGSEPDHIRIPSQMYSDDGPSFSDMFFQLERAKAVAFDLETSGYDETEPDAFIVSIALTVEGPDGVTCWAVPLCHEDSPFRNSWATMLGHVADKMRDVPVRIGHNAKFDCRWLAQFNAPVPCNFDTMLAAHLLDENRAKSLKQLARTILKAPEWDIHIKAGKKDPPWYEQLPLSDILRYNALDTWHTYRLYKVFSDHFTDSENEGPAKVFHRLMMPASQSLVHIERHGIYVDSDRLKKNAAENSAELAHIASNLQMFVPLSGVPEKYRVNWNPSDFLRWLMFDHLGLPVLQVSPLTGKPSVSDGVMKQLAETYPIAGMLLERTHLEKKRSTYFEPYLELLGDDSRLRTTFKLAGTVTGRMSSGKADAEKVTGARNVRGVNAQQVPRDKDVRSIFSAPPGWFRVDADYSQLELRLAAEVANERVMLGMYARGEDLHTRAAMTMTGKPIDEITKEERTKAKARNFGFLYGMGWEGFISYAFNMFSARFYEEEARNARESFFAEFPGLRPWHTHQKRMAHKYGRVQTPLGRVRRLPDIHSLDRGVQSEAERQAINAPIQGFGSDLCLLSIVLLHRLFVREGMRSVITNNVHDSIGFEIPADELATALPLIKKVMENPPTERMFGYRIKVPLVADISVGTHWGEQTEIPAEHITTPALYLETSP